MKLQIIYLFSVTLFASCSLVSSKNVCNIHCDDRPSRDASGAVREPVGVNIDYRGRIRRIALRISDHDNMGYAEIRNGEPGDQAWIERKFNGEWSNEAPQGVISIPSGRHEVSTNMFNVDNPSEKEIGALRACAKYMEASSFVTCTEWARSTVAAENKLDAAVTALMMFYEPVEGAFKAGLWRTVGWWNSANALTSLIDYHLTTTTTTTTTGSPALTKVNITFVNGSPVVLYRDSINNTFEINKGVNEWNYINFTSGSIDDTLWWGLAWVKAYDLTGEQKYLDMAVIIADFCYQFHDNVCGGGIWWSDAKTYKNAVTNEQYIKLAAQLANRISGNTKYLDQAKNLWEWFKNSGMINEDNLINDGLDNDNCQNNGDETWTYNQGIVLGALVELWNATQNKIYLNEAMKIAHAVIKSTHINDKNGVLFENCFDSEPDCGPNAPCFKGIFMRNLGELYEATMDPSIAEYIMKNAESVYSKNRNALNQYGLFWSGLMDFSDASRQQSAVDLLVAAEKVKNLN